MRTISSKIFLLAIFVFILASCKRIDDNRIPPVNVNIVFNTPGMWAAYGVGGALDHRSFIRTTTMKVPADFPYTVSTYTGYGGVLLVGNMYGFPEAYDLSCPFEAKPDIRIEVNDDTHDAACKICGSVYDVFFGQGRPVSGPAAERGYGLTRYRILDGNEALNYRIITR